MVPYREDLIAPIIGQASFGIWDLLNKGSDTFGAATREGFSAEDSIRLLGMCGVPHVSLHDIDVGLDPWTTPDPRALDKRFQELKACLDESGVKVWMYTPCLFHHALARAGSVTSNDAHVRRMSLQKILLAADMADAFGAPWITLWLGRDGAEIDALIDSKTAYQRIADAVQVACSYIRQRGYQVKISLEPKPNEPRGDIFVSTVGTAVAIINMLPEADRELLGVNPELLQHEGMAGLNAYHALGQLLAADKLAFLHLGGQTPNRYDQDHPFLGGNSDMKQSMYIMLAIARHKPDCTLEFDCHPFRTEGGTGAREEFIMGNLEAAGLMMAKAKSFLAHPEVAALLDGTMERGFGIDADYETDMDAFLQQIATKRIKMEDAVNAVNPQAQYLDRLLNLHLTGSL